MPSDPKTEYTELGANMRFYGNLRFAQLTIFMAITAGLLNVTFNRQAPLNEWANVAIKLAGALAPILFWIMEERATSYWRHYHKRAVELDKTLGYNQYINRPMYRIPFLNSTNAVRLAFLLITLFWILTLAFPSKF